MFIFILEICVFCFSCTPRPSSSIPWIGPRSEALYGKCIVFQSFTGVGYISPSEDRRIVWTGTVVSVNKQPRLDICFNIDFILVKKMNQKYAACM